MIPMKEQLKSWCRYASVDDTRDNGVNSPKDGFIILEGVYRT